MSGGAAVECLQSPQCVVPYGFVMFGTCNVMKNHTSKTQRGASLIAPGTDRLITKREAAERLGVCVRSVERLISAGKLHVQRIGRCARLRLSQVLSLAGIQTEMIPSQP